MRAAKTFPANAAPTTTAIAPSPYLTGLICARKRYDTHTARKLVMPNAQFPVPDARLEPELPT